MDSNIRRYIDTRVEPKFIPVAERLVDLIAELAPELSPGMRGGTEKYHSVPVWRGKRDALVLSAAKTGLTLSFAKGANFPDPHGVLGGLGVSSRTYRLRNPDDVRHPALPELLRQAVANSQ